VAATKQRKVKCDQCQLLRINGVVCHEIGCPNATVSKTCKWCDREFRTKDRFRQTCSPGCQKAWRC
jgi:hypothetical protein